jgi:hypothetical protein
MARYSFDDLPAPERTRVNSKTYGEHTRACRGSKSKAELNDTLKRHTHLLIGANVPARLVKQAIDNIREGFPSGQLWQSLVGMFKMQLKLGIPLNVDPLMYKDIHKDYRQSRLAKQGYIHTISADSERVAVNIRNLRPVFRRTTIDRYMVRINGLFFDFDTMEFTSECYSSPIVPLDHGGLLSFEFKKGDPGNRYLISLSLAGCSRQEVSADNSMRSMLIIQAGIVTEKGLKKLSCFN